MNAITKVSAKGQIVIPKDVRDRLHWTQGTELEVIDGASGVTLRTRQVAVDRTEFDRKLAALRGLIHYSGPRIDDEDAKQAIDAMFCNDPQWDAPQT